MCDKKYQRDLVREATLEDNFYNYELSGGLQPCAYFFKELIKCGPSNSPSVLIPDTLLLNDKQNPLIWIFTNSKGHVDSATNINLKDFVNKITNYCSPNELSACLKRVTYNDRYINGNDVKLLNARYLQNCSQTQLGGQSETLVTVQRFIKSNGNKAFICRTVWRSPVNSSKSSQCYMITNKKSFFEENEPQSKRFLVKVAPTNAEHFIPTTTIVKSNKGKHLQETSKYLTEIADFMKLYRGVVFSEIVADFIKDESGNWWLLNVKAFQAEQKIIRNPYLTAKKSEQQSSNYLSGAEKSNHQNFHQKQKYQKTKICRYCQKNYLESELTHYMTIKMLIETDKYLLHLGKEYKWLKRSDTQNVDSHCLYQEHKICERCYRLYTEIQALMEVEGAFLKKMGFQLQKSPKELLMSLTNQEQLKNESKTKEMYALSNFDQTKPERNHMTTITEEEEVSPQKLSNIRTEKKLKTLTNIQTSENQTLHEKDAKIKCISMNKSIQPHKVHQKTNFPQSIELGPNSKIVFDEGNCPLKNDEMINTMMRYRLVLYLKEIDQISLAHIPKDPAQYNYFLEYEIFGIKNRLKIDFYKNFDQATQTLSIKKLKINYFFSHSHKNVFKYLCSQKKENSKTVAKNDLGRSSRTSDFSDFQEDGESRFERNDSLLINIVTEEKYNQFLKNSVGTVSGANHNSSLYQTAVGEKKVFANTSNLLGINKPENDPASKRISSRPFLANFTEDRERRKVIGHISLPMKELFGGLLSANSKTSASKIIKKDFYKFFSIEDTPHGWGLEGSIGIIPSETYVSTSRMIFFTDDHLIYLPNSNYYYCEHLPGEWMDMIRKELPDRQNFDCTTGVDTTQLICGVEEGQQIKLGTIISTDGVNTPIHTTNSQSSHKIQQKQKMRNLIYENKSSSAAQSLQVSTRCLNKVSEEEKENKKGNDNKANYDDWKKSILSKELFKYEKAQITKGKSRNMSKKDIGSSLLMTQQSQKSLSSKTNLHSDPQKVYQKLA